MKPIKLVAAIVISLASLTAHASIYFAVDNGSAPQPVASNNDFKPFLAPQNYIVGGQVKSIFDGVLSLDFTYLGHEASAYNSFTSSSILSGIGGTITTASAPAAQTFAYSDDFDLGELLNFSFSTSYPTSPSSVSNSSNPNYPVAKDKVSFATAFDTSFKGAGYDMILFFDDAGGAINGVSDDDNHDDLLIGVRVLTATTRSVPEPSSIALLMAGLVGMFAARRLKA